MTIPKVCIIIPIYNTAPYIIKCLESVYNQSHSNIEVILVDDCSTDNSMKVVSQFLSFNNFKNIKIIHHKKNKGLSAARNTGIANSTSDYLYFLDSDDYIANNCIDSFIQLVNKYNYPEIVFGTAQYVPYKWKNCNISINLQEIPEYTQNKKLINKLFFIKEYLPITAWNKLIKRDYLMRNNLLFKENIIYEDNLWYWYIGNTIKSIAFNKETTYFYRYVPNSIINKPYNKINMYSEAIIIKDMFKSITFDYFFRKLIYILHFSHSSYCKSQSDKPLSPCYIRYPKAFIYFIKCLFNN